MKETTQQPRLGQKRYADLEGMWNDPQDDLKLAYGNLHIETDDDDTIVLSMFGRTLRLDVSQFKQAIEFVFGDVH